MNCYYIHVCICTCILPAQFRTVLKSKLNVFFFLHKSFHFWNRISSCLGPSPAPLEFPAPLTILPWSSPSGHSGLSALPCTRPPWCSQSELCKVTCYQVSTLCCFPQTEFLGSSLWLCPALCYPSLAFFFGVAYTCCFGVQVYWEQRFCLCY